VQNDSNLVRMIRIGFRSFPGCARCGGSAVERVRQRIKRGKRAISKPPSTKLSNQKAVCHSERTHDATCQKSEWVPRRIALRARRPELPTGVHHVNVREQRKREWETHVAPENRSQKTRKADDTLCGAIGKPNRCWRGHCMRKRRAT
jgi:hypothetical protein